MDYRTCRCASRRKTYRRKARRGGLIGLPKPSDGVQSCRV